MILIDTVLAAPMRGLFWIVKEIHKAAEQDQEDEANAITQKLVELYERLESGMITEEEFDASEKKLLDRLDELQGTLVDVAEEEVDEVE